MKQQEKSARKATTLAFRVDPWMKDLIAKRAKADNRTPSDWIRIVIERAIREGIQPDPVDAEMLRLIDLLRESPPGFVLALLRVADCSDDPAVNQIVQEFARFLTSPTTRSRIRQRKAS